MNDEKQFWLGFYLGILAGAAILTFILAMCGKLPVEVQHKFEADAVRLGYGQYFPGADNEPKFQWKKNQ